MGRLYFEDSDSAEPSWCDVFDASTFIVHGVRT